MKYIINIVLCVAFLISANNTFSQEDQKKPPEIKKKKTTTVKQKTKPKVEDKTKETNSTVKKPTVPEGMVLVEGGGFYMGSNEGEADEKPIHNVYVNSFYLDKYEVTVGDYRKYCAATGKPMPEAPSWKWNEDHPMVNITWGEASEYARWLGKRLPTEAEWEYAARGGNKSRGYIYSGSDNVDEVAWSSSNSNSRTQTQRVGTKKTNELGIYDMSGNVWEWCSDWYDEKYYSSSPERNPSGPSSGTYKVLRGGSWNSYEYVCRVSNRIWGNPSLRYNNYGFRCAQDLK